MKKILTIIFIILCSFSLSSCRKETASPSLFNVNLTYDSTNKKVKAEVRNLTYENAIGVKVYFHYYNNYNEECFDSVNVGFVKAFDEKTAYKFISNCKSANVTEITVTEKTPDATSTTTFYTLILTLNIVALGLVELKTFKKRKIQNSKDGQ